MNKAQFKNVEEMPLPVAPQILNYLDFRLYLFDLIQFKRTTSKGWSFRALSKRVGFKSPNYFQLIIQGKRNLGETTAERLANAMGLTTSETHYFTALVRFDNASNEKERCESQRWIMISAKKLSTQMMSEKQNAIFENWYLFLVRELVVLKGFKPEGEYISQKLGGLISSHQAQEALQSLLQSGFIKKIHGKYELSEPCLDSGNEIFVHSEMQKFHKLLLQHWAKNIENLSPLDQELGVLNIPISRKKIPELKKRIREFQDEIVGILKDEKDADTIVQLGTYLFPY